MPDASCASSEPSSPVRPASRRRGQEPGRGGWQRHPGNPLWSNPRPFMTRSCQSGGRYARTRSSTRGRPWGRHHRPGLAALEPLLPAYRRGAVCRLPLAPEPHPPTWRSKNPTAPDENSAGSGPRPLASSARTVLGQRHRPLVIRRLCERLCPPGPHR